MVLENQVNVGLLDLQVSQDLQENVDLLANKASKETVVIGVPLDLQENLGRGDQWDQLVPEVNLGEENKDNRAVLVQWDHPEDRDHQDLPVKLVNLELVEKEDSLEIEVQ